MTDSMKFGPEWLRNLSADGTQSHPAPKYQLAEHRYGREEMLALFDRQVKAPDRLVALPALYIEKTQPPLALIQMNEEETRMWNRGINSDAVLRLNNKVAPVSIPSVRGGLVVGRGGSVDRGRGRARGQGYHYTRGVSYEETGDGGMQEPTSGVKITYNRNISRPFDRAQSMAGVERGWSERNGGDPQDWNGSTSPRKEFVRGFDNNWRRPRGNSEDEDGWRTATGSGSTKYVRPSSWREGEKEGAGGEVGGGRWEGTRAHRAWEGDTHRYHMDPDNLPEWAMENPSESGGSFDASGAFHGGGHSDEEEDVIGHGDPGQDQITSDGPKRRSPDHAKKLSSSSHITKSQSTSALPSTNHAKPPSPAKTQQKQSNQNTVKKSTSANAIQVPSPSLNNGSDNIHPPAPSNHFPLLNTAAKQNNNVNYEVNPAVYQVTQNSNNGFPLMNSHNVGGIMNVHNANVVMNQGHSVSAVHSVGGNHGHIVRPMKSDDDLDRMQVDADSLVDKLTADEEEKKLHQMAAIGQQSQEQEKWFYRDPQSEVQGPFAAQEMDEWFRAGYFNVNLLVRRACDERFAQLGDLIKAWGRVPFLAGPYVPPLKNDIPSPVSMAAPVPQVKPMPALDQESMIQQQQYQYQQLLHRQVQLGQQQAAYQAIVGKLSQSERWASLSPIEQQQLVMQQMVDPSVFLPPPPQQPNHQKNPVLQQFISQMKPTDKPSLPPLHPLQQLIQQMGGMGQAPQPIGHQMHSQEAGLKSGPIGHQMHVQDVGHKMEQDPIQNLLRQINANKPQVDVWGNPLSASSWMSQVGQMPAAPPPGQLPMSMWDIQGKDMKTEQQIIEERLRAEEEKRVEEAMKKAEVEEKRRKQKEEAIKIKEMEKQRLEDERQRIEEARRKEEEEKRMELQEQKRLEDEMRKREKEEKKRKEEEKKKREEEKKRKEEEKERKRKLEEERKRDEEEKKRLEEEAARKRQEEEEQVRRVEQQHQAFKRLQERAKAAPWSLQAAQQQAAGNSLAEIQRQEKVQKERESREQQVMMQNMQLIQQQQQQQAAVLLAQTDKNSSNLQLKWADRKPHVSKVKSLSEIQAEEAKHSERERAERSVKEVVVQPSAGIWSAAPQSLSWATAANAAWSSSSQQGGGFWDDVPAPAAPAPVSRPAAKAKSAPPAQASPAAPKAAPAKNRNKKEEAVVMKLFDNQRGDDFTQWCTTSLHNIEAHVDIPTFVGFLRDIESPYEVKDYVKMYLGESKESQEFARQFLERRSKWRSAQRAAPQHDDLAQPAPAINPSSMDFQEVKGKAKKIKKNKMCKVDSRILGFSVTAAQDRINVGDRDYGEGV